MYYVYSFTIGTVPYPSPLLSLLSLLVMSQRNHAILSSRSLVRGADLHMCSHPVTANSPEREDVIVASSPWIIVHEAAFVVARVGELSGGIEDSPCLQREGLSFTGICRNLWWQTPSPIVYEVAVVTTLALTSIQVERIRLITTEESVGCSMLIEFECANLSSLLKVATLGTCPNLTVQRSSANVLDVPAPKIFRFRVWIITHYTVTNVELFILKACRVAWTVDIPLLAIRRRHCLAW